MSKRKRPIDNSEEKGRQFVRQIVQTVTAAITIVGLPGCPNLSYTPHYPLTVLGFQSDCQENAVGFLVQDSHPYAQQDAFWFESASQHEQGIHLEAMNGYFKNRTADCPDGRVRIGEYTCHFSGICRGLVYEFACLDASGKSACKIRLNQQPSRPNPFHGGSSNNAVDNRPAVSPLELMDGNLEMVQERERLLGKNWWFENE